MKATVMYDTEKHKWHLYELHLSADFFRGAEYIKKRLTDVGKEVYLHVLDVELTSFEITGDKSYLWSSEELPKTPSLADRIKDNKDKIINCLNKLNNRSHYRKDK